MKKKILTVGEITYANCFPIFYHLRRNCSLPDVRFISGQPAGLNAALRRGEVDICISSSVEYARNPEHYFVLPRFCISSITAIWSIHLFSRVPLENLDRKSVVLTGESDTSVVLCRIILEHFMGFENDFTTEITDLEQALERADAVLLIGDRALAARNRADNLYSYDLGSIWYERTGLPFVFALWTLRKDAAQELGAVLKIFWDALCEAHRSPAQPDVAMVASAVKAKPFMTSDSIRQYWKLISYELSAEHLKGLELFYRLGNKTGILGTEPEILFFEP